MTLSELISLLASCLKKNASHSQREVTVQTLGRIPVGDPDFALTKNLLSLLLATAEVRVIQCEERFLTIF